MTQISQFYLYDDGAYIILEKDLNFEYNGDDITSTIANLRQILYSDNENYKEILKLLKESNQLDYDEIILQLLKESISF